MSKLAAPLRDAPGTDAVGRGWKATAILAGSLRDSHCDIGREPVHRVAAVDSAWGEHRPWSMRNPAILLLAAAWLLSGCTAASQQTPGRTVTARDGASPSPTADLRHWSVEQMPGGTVTTRDGALIIEDAAGCTVWYREPLRAPVEISYEVTVIARGGPHDRVSDLNCFWMATDPKAPAAMPAGRSGRFAEYDSLVTYYVGYGGNTNTTTRFRRYDGTPARPLLPEHDLREPKYLLKPNKTYRIRLVARDGMAEYWRDGERIFSYHDPQPLTRGWFAFRTVRSHLEIRNFEVLAAR